MPRKKSETNRSHSPLAPKAFAFGAFFVPARKHRPVSPSPVQPIRSASRAGIEAPGLLSSKSDGECALSLTYRPQLPEANPSTPHFPQKSGGLLRKTLRFSPESPPIFLKIPRFPKEYGELFDLGRLQNAESRTKKIYFGLATCEKLLTFVVR